LEKVAGAQAVYHDNNQLSMAYHWLSLLETLLVTAPILAIRSPLAQFLGNGRRTSEPSSIAIDNLTTSQ
jgi:hypothetical protein